MEQIAIVAAVLAAGVMFGLGLDLTPGDFATVIRRPVPLFVGLLMQWFVIPGLAFAICLVAAPEAGLVAGLMVVAACPGSAPANVMTRLAGGNTALSLSLTGISSALSFVTIPAALALGAAAMPAGASARMPLLGSAAKVLAVTGIPLILGMACRRRWPGIVPVANRVVPPVSVVALVGVVGSTVWLEWDAVVRSLATVGWRVLGLNVLTLAGGFVLARLGGVDRASRTAICLESSLHNCALGVFVAVTLLGGGAVVLPTLAYALLMWGTAIPFVLWARRTRATVLPPVEPVPA